MRSGFCHRGTEVWRDAQRLFDVGRGVWALHLHARLEFSEPFFEGFGEAAEFFGGEVDGTPGLGAGFHEFAVIGDGDAEGAVPFFVVEEHVFEGGVVGVSGPVVHEEEHGGEA